MNHLKDLSPGTEKKLFRQLLACFIGLSIGMWLWYLHQINEVRQEAARDAQEIARILPVCVLSPELNSPECRELERLFAKYPDPVIDVKSYDVVMLKPDPENPDKYRDLGGVDWQKVAKRYDSPHE